MPLLSVVGGNPYDIRFHIFDGTAAGGAEQVGQQLDHQVVSYDPVGLTARFFVRLPSWTTNQPYKLWVYYGKAGLAASEENIPGTWTGATMVIDPTTGNDLTGRGRAFTRNGTLTNTTLDGRPAVSMVDQTGGFLRRTNADLSVFDGFGAAGTNGFTVEYWAKIATASSGNIERLGGAAGDTFPKARFSGWAEHVGSAGSKADVLQAGANWYATATGYSNESTESLAGVADGSTVRHVMVVRQSNTHTQIYDGETNVSSADYANAPSVGTIHPQSTDNYSLGAGTGAQNTSPGMTLGLYAVWPFGFSATRRALADRTQRDSSSVVSIGAEDAFGDADRSPVAGVFQQTVTATVNIDVLAAPTFDPDAAATLAPTAVTNPDTTIATCSISAGKVQVVPAGGAGGSIEPVYTISDGTKSAQAKLLLSVSPVVVTTTYFSDPNFTAAGGGTKTAVTVASATALTTALQGFNGVSGAANYASSSHYIVVTANLTADYTIAEQAGKTRNLGSQAHPLIVMAGTQGAKNVGSVGFSNCALTVTAQWIWLYQLKFSRPVSDTNLPNLKISADNFFITRSYLYSSASIENIAGNPAGQHYNIGYNKFDGHSTVNGHCIRLECDRTGPANQPDFGHIYRNWFTSDADSYRGVDQGSQPSYLYTGQGIGNGGTAKTPVDINLNNVLFELNYGEFGRRNTLYIKHALRIERNHLRKRKTGTDLNDGVANVQSPNEGHNPGFRGGNVWYGTICFNRLEGGANVALQGWNHDCVGNIISGANLQVELTTKDNTTQHPKTLLGSEHCVLAGNDWSAAGATIIGKNRPDSGYTVATTEELGWDSPPNVKLIGNTGGYVDDSGKTMVFANGHPSGSYQYIDNNNEIDYVAAKPATVAGNGGRQGAINYDLSTSVPDFSANTARQVGPSATDGNATWAG